MKVIDAANSNVSFGFGISVQGNNEDTKENKASQVKNVSIFGGNLKNMMPDRIEQKREEARKKASKVLMDQVARDNVSTDALKESRSNIKKYKEEISSLMKEREYYTGKQEELKSVYGIEEGSDEQKDLELLRSASKDLKNGNIALTGYSDEELERIQNAASNSTEYQRRSLANEEVLKYYDSQIEELQKEAVGESNSISAIKQGMLKQHGMDDAKKTADGILEAASDQIIGMLMEDAKSHVDEELAKLVEAAKEAAEKKKTEEQKTEEAKAETEEQKDLTESIQEGVVSQDKIQQELEKIVKDSSLAVEDLKGLVVDTQS